MRIPLYVNGDIPISDLARALASVGYHLRIDAGHRFVVDRIPAIVARDIPAAANVVPLKKGRK